MRHILINNKKDDPYPITHETHPYQYGPSFLLLIRMRHMCYWVRIILFVIDKDVSHVLLGTDHFFC